MASQILCFKQFFSSFNSDSALCSRFSASWTAESSYTTRTSTLTASSRNDTLLVHVPVSLAQFPRELGPTLTLGLSSSEEPKRGSHTRPRRFIRATPENVDFSAQSANSSADRKREYFLPTTLENSIDQARMAARQAISEGVKRLQLEMPLPLIGATDLDDWPGGIQQQFKAAGPVIKSLLKGLVDGEPGKEEGGYRNYMIDKGDAVAAWENEKAAVVLFPTAGTIRSLEDLAKKQDRPLLIVNAQWQSGQVISDFGFGSRRRAAEEFVNTFETVYLLKAMRIRGEDLRLLKRYPGDWQIFVVHPGGGASNKCVETVTQRPSYKDLENILKNRKDAKANPGWLGKLFSEFEFNRKSLTEKQK